MFFLPIRVKLVSDIINNRKFLKFANGSCHKYLGAGIKDTLNKHPHVKQAGQKIKNIWDYFDLLTELS